MAVQISLFASELHRLLTALKKNRQVRICDIELGFYVRDSLNLSGEETRPLSDEEIRMLTTKFAGFRNYFQTLELWPDVNEG